MEQPAPFYEGNKKHVCLLKKSLYGLRQSGRAWNERLDEFLLRQGLSRSVADPCVYYNGEGGLIVGMYVDDILILARNEKTVENFKSEIGKVFKVKNLGEAPSMRIERRKDGTLTLDQTTYAEELVELFGMKEECFRP